MTLAVELPSPGAAISEEPVGVLAVTDVLNLVMCGTCRGSRNEYGALVGKLTARDRLEDGRKILGCVLKQCDRIVWLRVATGGVVL